MLRAVDKDLRLPLHGHNELTEKLNSTSAPSGEGEMGEYSDDASFSPTPAGDVHYGGTFEEYSDGASLSPTPAGEFYSWGTFEEPHGAPASSNEG